MIFAVNVVMVINTAIHKEFGFLNYSILKCLYF